MFCGRCGQRLLDNAHYCIKCGAKVVTVPTISSHVVSSLPREVSQNTNSTSRGVPSPSAVSQQQMQDVHNQNHDTRGSAWHFYDPKNKTCSSVCPKCGSMSQQNEPQCGVCGFSFGAGSMNGQVWSMNRNNQRAERRENPTANFSTHSNGTMNNSTNKGRRENVRSIVCSNCGSSLVIVDNNREFAFCEFCGTKLILDDYRVREHYVDEAAMRRVEYEEKVRMRELDIEEQNRARYARLRKIVAVSWIAVMILLIIVMLVMYRSFDDIGIRINVVVWGLIFLVFLFGGGIYLLFHALPEKENELMHIRNGGIRFPDSTIMNVKYMLAVQTLHQLGYKNVSVANMHDLTFGFGIYVNGDSIKAGEGDIASITVNGKTARFCGYYMPNDLIIIYYHGKR